MIETLSSRNSSQYQNEIQGYLALSSCVLAMTAFFNQRGTRGRFTILSCEALQLFRSLAFESAMILKVVRGCSSCLFGRRINKKWDQLTFQYHFISCFHFFFPAQCIYFTNSHNFGIVHSSSQKMNNRTVVNILKLSIRGYLTPERSFQLWIGGGKLELL